MLLFFVACQWMYFRLSLRCFEAQWIQTDMHTNMYIYIEPCWAEYWIMNAEWEEEFDSKDDGIDGGIVWVK